MDATDRKLAETMIRQWTENLDDMRATHDTPYDDIAYALTRLGYWSARLHAATFGQIRGSSR